MNKIYENSASIAPLLPKTSLEANRVFEALATANRALGELKGTAKTKHKGLVGI